MRISKEILKRISVEEKVDLRRPPITAALPKPKMIVEE